MRNTFTRHMPGASKVPPFLCPRIFFLIEQEKIQAAGYKKCRLSWLTNCAVVYEHKCGRRGGVAWSQPMMSNDEYSCTQAQINFGDLILYLTYVSNLQKRTANKKKYKHIFTLAFVDQ
jgi:hypothetical protein